MVLFLLISIGTKGGMLLQLYVTDQLASTVFFDDRMILYCFAADQLLLSHFLMEVKQTHQSFILAFVTLTELLNCLPKPFFVKLI